MKRIETRKIIWIAALVLCIATCIFSAVFVLNHLIPKKNKTLAYRDKTVNISSVSSESKLPDNPVDFAGLQARNPDICAWIHIPGSEKAYNNDGIDYPILQSGKDKEEDYYLTHDLDGKELFDGSIYIQRLNGNKFEDRNTVIYGHDLYNYTMFTPLRKYRNKEFFDENEYIYIYTPGHVMKYHLYSAFVYDDRHLLYSFDFENDEEYAAFLEETLHPTSTKRLVREGVEVTTNDKIITLSTCTNYKTERFLVVGVLVEDIITN